MRLYTEYIRQKDKQEEEKKRSFERYQEKIENNRMNIPKVRNWINNTHLRNYKERLISYYFLKL